MYQDFIKTLKKWPLTILVTSLGISSVIYFGIKWFPQYFWQEQVNVVQPSVSIEQASNSTANSATSTTNNTFVPEEGKNYFRMAADVTTNPVIQALIAENPGKIQVIEFFNYGCHWCEVLHPVINNWTKTMPSNVAFMRFPLIFNEKWASLAKAFYVAHALGKADQLEPKIFKAIHKDNIDLSDEKLLRSFMVDHGIDEKSFLDQYHSFSVNKEVKKAAEIGNAYQITVSPVIIINGPSGSFYLTAALAGNDKALITLMNHVIAEESQKLPKVDTAQKNQDNSPIGKSK